MSKEKKTTKLQEKRLIPQQAKQAIESTKLSRIMKAKSYKLCSILIWKAMTDEGDLSAFQLLSTKYFETVFGKDFNKGFLNILIASGIIEKNREQDQRNGIPYGYRIAQNLINGDWEEVFFNEGKDRKEVAYIKRMIGNNEKAIQKFSVIPGKRSSELLETTLFFPLCFRDIIRIPLGKNRPYEI